MYTTTVMRNASYESPEAFITTNKNRKKIYRKESSHKIIYLRDQEKFEIELYNPKTIEVLVKLKINGEYISYNGLILKPGDRVFLERYLDNNKAFIFNTYTVKNNKKNINAIENNGVVAIEFYDQITMNIPYIPYQDVYIPNYEPTITWTYRDATPNTNPYIIGPNSYCCSNADIKESSYCCSNNDIKTGRIQEGKETNQTLKYSDGTFNQFPSKLILYKIIPIEQQIYTKKDIRKYCTECGTKQKEKYKYCPNCGKKV